MATRALNVIITGDSKGIGIAAREAEGHLRVVQRSAKVTGAALKVGFGLGAAGVLLGVGALKKSVKAAEEAQTSQARLKAQLKASGISYRAHAKDIDAVIQKHSKLAGIDDEDLQDAFTNLVRSTGKVSTAMHDMGLVTDLARAKHIDVTKAADLLGKVHAGNTSILKRYGIALDPVTKAQDKLKESNKHATAEQIAAAKASDKQATSQSALATLQKRFGGQAEAYGKTAAGAQERFGVALENVEEKIGAGLLPVLAKGANAVANFLGQIESGKGAGGALAKGVSTAFNTIKTVISTVITAVRGYLLSHRQDLASVITAFKKVADFAKTVWQETLLPIIKRSVAAIGPIIKGLVDVIRGVVRLVSGLLSGNWSKAWSGAKEIVSGAFKAIKTVVTVEAENIWQIIKTLGPKLVKAIGQGFLNVGKAIVTGLGQGLGNIGHFILDKLKDALHWVTSHLPHIKLPFGLGSIGGDGPGFSPGGALPSGGAFGGSLMGARSSLRPFAAIGSSFGLGVTDGKRPAGTRTASGGVSYHSTGEAIDMGDGRGPDSNKLGFFKYLKSKFGGQLAELIYTPGGTGIKDGRPFRYTGAVAADHFDHVHVAFDTGRPGVGDGHGRSGGRFKGDGLGDFTATSYGPPWGGIQGGGVTATGVNLKGSPHEYGVAVDPKVIPLGSKLKITPNPFGYSGAFTAFDTGGAIKGKRIDFYDWRGRKSQLGWGRKTVSVSTVTGGGSSKTKPAKITHGSVTTHGVPYDPTVLYPDTSAQIDPGLAAFKAGRAGPSKGTRGAPAKGLTPGQIAGAGAADDSGGDPNQPLIDAINELARIEAEKAGYESQLVANQLKIIAIAGQGDQIVNAVISAVNGGIGGTVGLGLAGLRSPAGSVMRS